MRELRKDSFIFAHDENGHEYVKMGFNEKEKTKRGLNMKEKEREAVMYSQVGDENCPVTHLRKYLSKLNPQCEAFYQRPKESNEGRIWYDNCAVGKNKLASMMKSMSVEAGLSMVYTNHCLRNTCVTALDRAGYETKDIMRITGHKHQSSLQPYIGKPSTYQVKSMSEAIHQYKESGPSPIMPHNIPSRHHNIPGPSSSQHVSMQSEMSSLFGGAMFKDCTFNVSLK
jgi:hypothetical protein